VDIMLNASANNKKLMVPFLFSSGIGTGIKITVILNENARLQKYLCFHSNSGRLFSAQNHAGNTGTGAAI
jgi:hypothetical protein